MPEVRYIINRKTGKVTMQIEGIAGEGCKPIHEALAADMSRFGVKEVESHDTDEMYESPDQLRNSTHLNH